MYNPYEVEAEKKIAQERYEVLKNWEVARADSPASARNGIGRIGRWLVAIRCTLQQRYQPERTEPACVR